MVMILIFLKKKSQLSSFFLQVLMVIDLSKISNLHLCSTLSFCLWACDYLQSQCLTASVSPPQIGAGNLSILLWFQKGSSPPPTPTVPLLCSFRLTFLHSDFGKLVTNSGKDYTHFLCAFVLFAEKRDLSYLCSVLTFKVDWRCTDCIEKGNNFAFQLTFE